MEIKAKMPGKVEEILVNVGDEVSEGQKVIICEAMKMKTPMASPCGGTVIDIKVAAGDRLNAGDVLIVVE